MPALAKVAFPKKVKLIEIGPRDGLQFEPSMAATESKIELINKLALAKMPAIECTSFMPPKLIPQLSDSRLIAKGILKKSTTQYIAFAPNREAVKFASEEKYDGISFAVTACEEIVKNSLKADVKTLLKSMEAVVADAKTLKLSTRGYISFAMGSELTPNMDPKRINEIAWKLHELGVNEIVLQDNIAAGNIEKVDALLNAVTIPKEKLAIHFHDSKYIGLDMVIYAMSKGIHNIDCAIAGLGQCAYNKSPLGNMVTEDMLFVLDCMGIEHGVEWKPLLNAGDFISEEMTRENSTDAFDEDFEEDMDDFKEKYAKLIKSLI